MHFSI